jgi:hypothetical protein
VLSTRDDFGECPTPLEKRGGREDYKTNLTGPRGVDGGLLVVKSIGYPGPTQLFTGPGRLLTKIAPFVFRATKQYYMGPATAAIKIPLVNPASIGFAGLDVEHPLDVSLLRPDRNLLSL